MKAKIKIILVGIAIIIAVILVVSVLQANSKLKQAELQIVTLNDLIAQKDADINKLVADLQIKQGELNVANKELESVKTELSNTVLRLQASGEARTTAK